MGDNAVQRSTLLYCIYSYKSRLYKKNNIE